MADQMFPLKAAGLAGLAAMQAVAPAAAAETRTFRYYDADVLGTRMNLTLVADDETSALAAARAARAEIERLDGVFNSRRADSELSALNGASRFVASSDMFDLVSRAEAFRAASDRAFDPRLGEALSLWRQAKTAPPDRAGLQAAVNAAQGPVRLDAETRTIERPAGAVFALDGLAKGYIVDRALEAGRASDGVAGMMVDIGGDVRCWGQAPEASGWAIGIGDPHRHGQDAACVSIAHLKDAAIATSGKGPRDRIIGGERFSPTLDPATGWAAKSNLSASVVARCAADADALASAFLVMDPKKALALADKSDGVAARVTAANGQVHQSSLWRNLATEAPARLIRIQTPAPRVSRIPVERRWGGEWQLEMTYVAPDRQEQTRRNPDFRSPYVAIWISDAKFNPVRTVTMVGKDPEWQRDNFIWWNAYKTNARRIIETRSEGTALSGRYSLFWRGIDDEWDPLPIGEYVLHLETSQERGKHTYRSVKLNIGREAFQTVVPATNEGGGLRVTYGPTNR